MMFVQGVSYSAIFKFLIKFIFPLQESSKSPNAASARFSAGTHHHYGFARSLSFQGCSKRGGGLKTADAISFSVADALMYMSLDTGNTDCCNSYPHFPQQ